MVQGIAEDILISGFGLVFVVAGLYAVNLGWTERTRSSEIADTETTEIRNLEAGRVEIKGTALLPEEASPVQSPISRTDALAAHVEVQEWDSSGRAGNWQTIHETVVEAPMLVDDGTGRIHVELPSDDGLNVEQTVWEVESNEEPPDDVRRYVENVAGLDIPERSDYGPVSIGEPRKYKEGYIEPGAEVYVLGSAREADAGWGERNFVIDDPTDSGEFILSDKSEQELVQEGKVGGLIYIGIGGLVTIAGVVTVVIPWLPQ